MVREENQTEQRAGKYRFYSEINNCNRGKRPQSRLGSIANITTEKWEFIAEDQGEVSGQKVAKRKYHGEGVLFEVTWQDAC